MIFLTFSGIESEVAVEVDAVLIVDLSPESDASFLACLPSCFSSPLCQAFALPPHPTTQIAVTITAKIFMKYFMIIEKELKGQLLGVWELKVRS